MGWWWTGKIIREKLISRDKVRFIDRLVPYVAAAEQLVGPPLGQSLFAVISRL